MITLPGVFRSHVLSAPPPRHDCAGPDARTSLSSAQACGSENKRTVLNTFESRLLSALPVIRPIRIEHIYLGSDSITLALIIMAQADVNLLLWRCPMLAFLLVPQTFFFKDGNGY